MIKKRFKIGLFLLLNMSILQAENVPSCYAVFSTEDLKIGDRAGTDGNGIVGSNSQVLVGHDATIVGSVVSAGNTMLYDRANIQGNITSGGTVTENAGAYVSGSISQNATVPQYTISSKIFDYGTEKVFVAFESIDSITSGSYDSITVQDRATLILKSGTYNVKSFYIGHDSKLILDYPQYGYIEINSAGDLIFDDRSECDGMKNLNSF